MATKPVENVYYFESSNKDHIYEAIEYTDGTTSCNCPGWVFKKSAGRGCKHTRLIEVGLASRDCLRQQHMGGVGGATHLSRPRPAPEPEVCPLCGNSDCDGAACQAPKPVPVRRKRVIQWQH